MLEEVEQTTNMFYESVSAQCMLFPIPLSKQEFTMNGVILL